MDRSLLRFCEERDKRMEFYSHPDKRLRVHLEEVWKLAERFDRGRCGELIKILCLSHDFGKYTSFFQEYLTTKRKTDRTNHGFISALLAAFLVMKKLEGKDAEKVQEVLLEGGDVCLPLMAYTAVLCHHGSVDNLDHSLRRDEFLVKKRVEAAETQRADMKKYLSIICSEYALWGYGDYIREFVVEGEFTQILDDLLARYKKAKRRDPKTHKRLLSSKAYLAFQSMYSVLIAADKISASDTPLIPAGYVRWEELNRARLQRIEEKSRDGTHITDQRKEINSIRTQIYEGVHARLEEVYDQGNTFSITAPTGTGKTYCGFLAAERLKDLLGDSRRIIYALPFTSIINQNYDEIRELMGRTISDFENSESAYLMKHHSLADVDYVDDRYEIDRLKAEMLIENWSSGVVVTTFVQLMETLIGNRNRMLKKFHSIAHSIILLDEVQAFPVELLSVIDLVLRRVTQELDCKVILMTATRPILLQDSVELLEGHERFFRMFGRTRLVFHPEKITLEEFAQDFLESMKDASYLVICNTIGESLELYRLLKDVEDRPVFYLSTNLLPIHRKERIEQISESLKDGVHPLVISTQVVEAGVDFDFEYVIRDIGPLDSIIQAAGRENRHGERKRGTVDVVCLWNGKKLYGSMVYGTTHIQITKRLLEKRKEIPEEDYLELIGEYFREVNENCSKDASEGFWDSVERLNFTEGEFAIGRFSLIEERTDYFDVFLQIDELAQELYERFQKMLLEKELELRRRLQLELRNKMAEYTLSIPKRFASRINHMKEEQIWTLPVEGCEVYYDEMTGFRRDEEEESYIIF